MRKNSVKQCFLNNVSSGSFAGVFSRLKYCTSEWINLVKKGRKPRPDLPKVRKFRVVLNGVKILILCFDRRDENVVWRTLKGRKTELSVLVDFH